MRISRLFMGIVCCLLLVLSGACIGSGGDNGPSAGDSSSVPGAEEPARTTPEPAAVIELYGETVSADAKTLSIASPVTDLSPLKDALSRLPSLESAELVRNFVPAESPAGLAAFEDEWLAVKNAYPNVAFSDSLLIDGAPAETLRAFSVSSAADANAEIAAVLRCCPALETLDLTEAAVSRETVSETANRVRVLFTDAVYGASDSSAESLSFFGAQDPDALYAYLSCFPALSEIDVTDTSLSEEQGSALCGRFPAVAVRREITLNGEPFDAFAPSLDFSGAEIASYEAFSDALQYFPALTRLDMHDCSLSNEQLAALRDRYPDVKVVWTVHMKKWTVRTDATAFSTLQYEDNTNRLRSDDAQVLQYCTDLIALDLGHNDLSDLEWLRPLKNLQVLILGDNRKIKNIEAIGTLTNLKYAELFLTGIEDVSPLANLSELLDVNLCFTKITDPSPLLSCTKLERIWLGKKTVERIKDKGVAMLTDAFPNAEFDLVSEGSTGRGWRTHPRYYAMYSMFHGGEPVEPFLP